MRWVLPLFAVFISIFTNMGADASPGQTLQQVQACINNANSRQQACVEDCRTNPRICERYWWDCDRQRQRCINRCINVGKSAQQRCQRPLANQQPQQAPPEFVPPPLDLTLLNEQSAVHGCFSQNAQRQQRCVSNCRSQPNFRGDDLQECMQQCLQSASAGQQHCEDINK